MNKLDIFNKFSKADVYLEEHNHVYVHKTTRNLYNSVTTALSLLKSDFDKDAVIKAIVRQYTNFIHWYRKNGGSHANLKDILFNYIMYGKQRPFQKYEDKKIYKALTKYDSIQELADELSAIKKKSQSILLKGFYLNQDNTVMSPEQILAIWDATNLMSRHYGHMIHESLELNFLDMQGFPIDRLKKIKGIQEKYNQLKDLLNSQDWGYNKEFFSIYELDLNAIEFMQWIINKFNKVRPYTGGVIIPEKVNFSPKYEICGTTDVEMALDDINFEIEDHKTNKEFTFINEYGKTMKAPFDDIPETSFSTYGLQLNIYGHIQEVEFGRRFKGARITFFDRQKKDFELIELPIMLDLAGKVLQHFKDFQDEYKDKFRTSGILDNTPSTHHNVLTKLLYENIEKRKKSNTIDLNDKKANKLYYQEFIQSISKNLSEKI